MVMWHLQIYDIMLTFQSVGVMKKMDMIFFCFPCSSPTSYVIVYCLRKAFRLLALRNERNYNTTSFAARFRQVN